MCKNICLHIAFLAIVCIVHLGIFNGDAYLFLWSLLIISAINCVGAFPRWRTAILNSLIIVFIPLVVEVFWHNYIQQSTAFHSNIPLALSIVTNLIIFFIMAYTKIKTHKSIEYLEEQAMTDPLMEIYNRRYFNLYMGEILPKVKKTRGMILLSIDIDYFKSINDTYGHVCGDEVLLRMSDIIKINLREHDKVFRMGGEEVVVLLPNTTLTDGKVVAERLRKTIETTKLKYQNKEIFVTVSIGVAQYNGETVKEFVEKADSALYRAKENGRNKVVIYDTNYENIGVWG